MKNSERPCVLNVGLHASLVTEMAGKRATFNTVDAATVRRGIEATRQSLDEVGLDFDSFPIDHDGDIEAKFREKLRSRHYEIIMIGGGVRFEPDLRGWWATGWSALTRVCGTNCEVEWCLCHVHGTRRSPEQRSGALLLLE